MADNMSAYYSELQKGRITPKDPFSHAAWLMLRDDAVSDKDLDLDLVNKQVILSYVGDDKLLRLYQNDIVILTQMRNLAARDPAMAPVYQVLYNGWQGELKMTRTKKGLERQLQGTTGGSYMPREQFGSGYGEELAQEARENEKKNTDIAGAVGGFFQRFKKR